MTWFKVDDGFHSHPKTIAAGNAAIGLWTRCGSHCSSYTTNGFVPKNIAKAFGTPAQVQRLLEVGLWREVSGGYQMHDFLDFNPTAEKVLADRAEAAERKRRWREQHRQSVTEVSRPGHAVTSASVTDLSHLPRPDPTRLLLDLLLRPTLIRGSPEQKTIQTDPPHRTSTRTRRPQHEHPSESL
jgi:hypothetical protein